MSEPAKTPMTHIRLTLPASMLQAIDDARDEDTPRVAWIRRAITQRLDRERVRMPDEAPTAARQEPP